MIKAYDKSWSSPSPHDQVLFHLWRWQPSPFLAPPQYEQADSAVINAVLKAFEAAVANDRL